MRVTEQPPFRSPEAQRLADQSPSPTNTPSRRLPSAPRERKPALAALAVLLIIGGAMITVTLVLRSGDRVSAIAVSQRIGAGQPIPLDALKEVPIANDGVSYIDWGLRDQVAGNYAAVDLVPDTLLNDAMVSRTSAELRPGKAVVGLSLKTGQAPPRLAQGQRVQVIYVPGDDTEPRVLARSALVDFVGGGDGTTGGGTLPVAVVVNTADAPIVAAYASAQKIALAYLPGVSAGNEPVGQESPSATTRPSPQTTPSVKKTRPTGAPVTPATRTSEPAVNRASPRPSSSGSQPGDVIQGQ
jgi:hypothetical protein